MNVNKCLFGVYFDDEEKRKEKEQEIGEELLKEKERKLGERINVRMSTFPPEIKHTDYDGMEKWNILLTKV